MSNVRSRWSNRSKRTGGILVGCMGLASLVLTFAPIWASPAAAALEDVDVGFDPTHGDPNIQVVFTITGCRDDVDTPLGSGLDISIEIDVHLDQGTGLDRVVVPANAQNTYTYLLPPEIDHDEGSFGLGPAYPVYVGCVEVGETEFEVGQFGTFTYDRIVTTTGRPTTTSTSSTTTTTLPASTSSTSSSTTTSTTQPGATSSTTAGGSSSTSTSTTQPASTASTASNVTFFTGATSSTTSTLPLPCAVEDPTPQAGQRMAVACTGLPPNSTVAIELLSAPVGLGTITANAQGAANGSVTIPAGTSNGAHELRFTARGPDGAVFVTSVGIDVGGVGGGGGSSVGTTIPRTGEDSWSMLRIGLLLVGFGLLALGRSQLVAAGAESSPAA